MPRCMTLLSHENPFMICRIINVFRVYRMQALVRFNGHRMEAQMHLVNDLCRLLRVLRLVLHQWAGTHVMAPAIVCVWVRG